MVRERPGGLENALDGWWTSWMVGERPGWLVDVRDH